MENQSPRGEWIFPPSGLIADEDLAKGEVLGQLAVNPFPTPQVPPKLKDTVAGKDALYRQQVKKARLAVAHDTVNDIIAAHASEPKCPEHLHIIACRIVPNTLAVIQEADGWYQRAMAHLCPILESDLSLNPEPGAVFYYDSAANKVVRKKHEIKTRFRLKESSRAFELQHANKKN